jgi:uncharacterized membrane protein
METLKRFLGWYLGVAPEGAGQGTSWKLTWSGTNVAQAWWPALLAAAVVFVLLVYYVETRRSRGALRWVLPSLRLATLLLLVSFLGELTLEVVRTGLPTVAVAIDTSASMNLDDRYSPATQDAAAQRMLEDAGLAAPTRLNLAKAILNGRDASFLERLGRNYQVRVYEFSDTVRPLGGPAPGQADDGASTVAAISALRAEGAQTRPGPCLLQLLNEFRGGPPAAVIIMTDGIASIDAQERLSRAVESAAGRCPPLFPIGLGSSEPARDLELDDPLVDPVAFVGDPVTFDLHLKAYDFTDKSVEVLLKAGHGGETLERVTVRIPGDGVAVPVRMSFTPPEEGDYEFVLESPPLPGETNLDNNVRTANVRIRREEIRVLLAERRPRWEYRHLKGVLERDDTIELHTVLQESDLTHQEEDRTALAAFPSARDDLFAYDVVILGDLDLSYLHPGALADLREFVREHGGGLILIAGARHNPVDFGRTAVADLLPVQLDAIAPAALPNADPAGIRLEPTLTGRHHPIFQLAASEAANRQVWSELPPLQWALESAHAKPGAHVLAQQPPRRGGTSRHPVIVLQRFGAGEVLFHATDELWQWRKRTEDLYYGRYWLQAVRYLCRSRLLGGMRGAELTSDRTTYDRGDAVQLRLRFVDGRLLPTDRATVTVAVERRGGRTESVTLQSSEQTPAVFEATLTHLQPGTYRAWLAEPALGETPPATDFAVELPRRELQQRSADLPDLNRAGQLSGGATIRFDDVDELFSRLPLGQSVPVANAELFPIWSRFEGLLLLVALLAAEWLLRKRARLV